jgi:hypothetical protein
MNQNSPSRNLCLLAATSFLIVFPSLASGQVQVDDPDLAEGRLARWIEQTRVSIDLSRRATNDTETADWRSGSAIGVDLQHVIATPRGDLGTLVFQGFFTGRHPATSHPFALDSGRDWDFGFRNFWFNFTALGRGLPAVRVGRFEVPFGLEHTTDTNGWLRQTIKARNVGLNSDWGISLNGVFPGLEYEASLTRGSNREWSGAGDPFLVGARVATPRWRGAWIGGSLLTGRVIDPKGAALWRTGLADPNTVDTSDPIVDRTRFGLESGIGWGAFEAQAEVSVGRDFDQRVLNSLLELDWESYTQNVLAYLQWRHYGQRYAPGWVSDDTLTLGVRFWPTRSLAFSAAASTQLGRFANGADRSALVLQLRYRT